MNALAPHTLHSKSLRTKSGVRSIFTSHIGTAHVGQRGWVGPSIAGSAILFSRPAIDPAYVNWHPEWGINEMAYPLFGRSVFPKIVRNHHWLCDAPLGRSYRPVGLPAVALPLSGAGARVAPAVPEPLAGPGTVVTVAGPEVLDAV